MFVPWPPKIHGPVKMNFLFYSLMRYRSHPFQQLLLQNIGPYKIYKPIGSLFKNSTSMSFAVESFSSHQSYLPIEFL